MRRNHLLCSRACPVFRARDSQSGRVLHVGRDQHSFITRKNSLTDGNVARSLVMAADIARAVDAVRLVRKWLLDVPVLVTEESTVLYSLAEGWEIRS